MHCIRPLTHDDLSTYSKAFLLTNNLIKEGKDGRITIPWPANFVLFYENRLLKTWHLHSAHQNIPRSAIVELLDTVRTRVLNMALQIQADVGQDDGDLEHAASANEGRITQTIIQNIYGGQGYAASGTMTIHQQTLTKNWENLATALRNSGLPESEVGALQGAVTQDGKKMGPAVMGWIKKNAPTVVSAGVRVGTTIGQNLLTEFLQQHFGLK